MAKSNYAVQIANFVKNVNDITDRVVREVILEVGTRIVNRSPVGDGTLWKRRPPKSYKGGRFRANWQYGNWSGGGIPVADLPDIDPSGAASIARIAGSIPNKPAGMKHILINTLPYAQALEDGWSTQAPAGMVGLVTLEFPQIVADAVAAEKET